MLFLKYEDLKRGFPSQLRQIAKFIGHELSDEAFEHVIDAASFKHMKASRFANHQTMRGFEGFFRKGEVGSWKERFTVAQSEAFDKVYQQRMAGTNLSFDFE
jgi:spore coat protein CotH